VYDGLPSRCIGTPALAQLSRQRRLLRGDAVERRGRQAERSAPPAERQQRPAVGVQARQPTAIANTPRKAIASPAQLARRACRQLADSLVFGVRGKLGSADEQACTDARATTSAVDCHTKMRRSRRASGPGAAAQQRGPPGPGRA